MKKEPRLNSLSDDDLLRRLSELMKCSRRVEADLVAHIGEVDERRLYAREAVSSMHAYCTEILRLTDFEAYLRITAARAARKYPMLLTMLRDGRLHLTAVARLASHLTRDNWETVLKRAANRSKREIEELIAELEPKPDVRATIRKLPARRATTPKPVPQLVPERVATPSQHRRPDEVAPSNGPALAEVGASSASPPVRQAKVEPLRYKVCFTASIELRDKLERLQALMRSSVPDGDLATIIDLAVTEKLERVEAKRFAKTKAPRKGVAESDTSPSSRHIPAAVRRAVHERDGGRCTYVDKSGRRCKARDRLEFHHREPFGRGGDHSPGNVAMLCATHNALLAERDYGKEVMARHRRSGGRVSEAAAIYSFEYRPPESRPQSSP